MFNLFCLIQYWSSRLCCLPLPLAFTLAAAHLWVTDWLNECVAMFHQHRSVNVNAECQGGLLAKSQATTTTRAQPNSLSSNKTQPAVAATAKKNIQKNCHANDSRVIVYRFVVVSSLPLVHVVVYCLLACAHTTKPICCRLNSSALAFTRPERHTILCWGAHSSFSHDVRFSFASCDSRLWRVICCLFGYR